MTLTHVCESTKQEISKVQQVNVEQVSGFSHSHRKGGKQPETLPSSDVKMVNTARMCCKKFFLLVIAMG